MNDQAPNEPSRSEPNSDPTDGRSCPSLREIENFSAGILEQESAEQLSTHLSSCDKCEQTVDSMQHPSDTLLNALGGLPTRIEFVDEPNLQQGIERLRQQTLNDRPDANAETQFSFETEPPVERSHPLDRSEDLGNYRLVRKLGEGGMGAVYQATHTQLDKTVAIKVLASNRFGDKQAVERFKREMKAIGRVQHPNVVVAHDGGQIGDEHFLVMEYVDGIDIAKLDQIHGPLPVSVACEIIQQSAFGLQHAHEMDLIHRDIKPSNLMLDQSGVVKVLDLGLARIETEMSSSGKSSADTQLTASGTAMGTIGFMSPEQALDSNKVTPLADLYSLGVTLFKLLSGTLPFPSSKYDTNGKMLVAIATEHPPSLGSVREDLPPKLIQLVDATLSKDPSKRTQTAAEFASQLEPFAGASLVGVASLPEGELAKRYADTDQTVVTAKPQTANSKRLGSYAAVALLLAPLLFAVLQIFWVRTEYGTLIVEVNDAQVEAVLQKNGVAIRDKANQRVWHLQGQPDGSKQLPKGKYRFDVPPELVITDTQGLEIRSDEFKLLNPDQSLRVRVSMAKRPVRSVGFDSGSEIRPGCADGIPVGWTLKKDNHVCGIAEVQSDDYELSFTAKRLSGVVNGLGVTLPLGNHDAVLVFGGWDGQWSAIEKINGIGGPASETAVKLDPFADGLEHSLLVKVTGDSITAWVDGRKTIAWKGSPTELTHDKYFEKGTRLSFVAMSGAQFELRNVNFTQGARWNHASSKSFLQALRPTKIADNGKQGFRLQFQAQRTSESVEGIGIELPIDGHPIELVFGGWGGSITAFGYNGKYSKKPGTLRRTDPFADGKPHVITIERDGESIKTWIDQQPSLSFSGPVEDIGLGPGGPATKNPADAMVVLRVYPSAVFKISELSFKTGQPPKMAAQTPIPQVIDEAHQREIAAAKWVESVGGKMFRRGPGSPQVTAADVEKEPGLVWHVDLSGSGALGNGPEALKDFPNLRVLFADHCSFGSENLDAILSNPQIYWLSFKGTPLTSKDFRKLTAFPRLNSLGVSIEQIDDRWEFMKELPWLPEINLNASEWPDLEQLCAYEQLDSVWLFTDFNNCPIPEERFFQKTLDAKKQNPNLRLAINFKIVGKDPVLEIARSLTKDGWTLSGNYADWIRPWNSKLPDAWNAEDWFHIRHITAPLDWQCDRETLSKLRALGHAFDSIQLKRATNTSLLPEYLRSRWTNSLVLAGSDLDDKTLALISNTSGIGQIILTDTKVTAAGVDAFKVQWPRCEVIGAPKETDPTEQ